MKTTERPDGKFNMQVLEQLLDKDRTPADRAKAVHDLIMLSTISWEQGDWGTARVSDQVGEPVKGNYIQAECASTACVAGWTTQLAGDRMLIPADATVAGGRYSASNVITADGEVHDISSRGAKLLGLQSEWLFGGDRTYREVLFGLEELAAGEQPSCSYDTENDEYDGDGQNTIPVDWQPTLFRTPGPKLAYQSAEEVKAALGHLQQVT